MLEDTFVSPFLSFARQRVVPGQCVSTVLSTNSVVSVEVLLDIAAGDATSRDGTTGGGSRG